MTDESSSYTAEIISEEIHENIDKKSFNIFRRKENERLLKELKILKQKDKLNAEEEDRLKILKGKLRKKIREIDFQEDSFSKIHKQVNKNIKILDEEEILIEFINEPTLHNFLSFKNNPLIFTEQFDDFLLYNLTENIKENNEETGFLLSLLNQLITLYKESKVSIEQMDRKTYQNFLRAVGENYEQEKKAIKNIQ